MKQSTAAVSRPAGLTPNGRGVLWMVLAMAIATGIDTAAKLVDPDLPLSVLIVCRAVLAIVILSPMLLVKGTRPLRTQRPGLHLVRGVLWYGNLFMVFFALRRLTIAEVNAYIFIEPLLTLFLAVLFLGERLTPRKLSAVMLGLVGVGVIACPQIVAVGGFSAGAGEMSGVAACILAAFGFAAMTVMGKRMVRTETGFAMLYYPQFVGLALFGVPALRQWSDPGPADLGFILMITVCALGTHYCLFRAVKVADLGAIAPAVYAALPFAVVVDVLVFGDWPAVTLWAGAGLVIASVLLTDRKRG